MLNSCRRFLTLIFLSSFLHSTNINIITKKNSICTIKLRHFMNKDFQTMNPYTKLFQLLIIKLSTRLIILTAGQMQRTITQSFSKVCVSKFSPFFFFFLNVNTCRLSQKLISAFIIANSTCLHLGMPKIKTKQIG